MVSVRLEKPICTPLCFPKVAFWVLGSTRQVNKVFKARCLFLCVAFFACILYRTHELLIADILVCVCVSLLSCSFSLTVLVIASILPSILSFRKNSMLYKNNKIQLMAVDHYHVFFPSICLSVDTGWDNQTWVSIEHKVGMYFEYVTTVHYVR